MKHSLTIVGLDYRLDASAYVEQREPSAWSRTAHGERADPARKKVRPH